MLCYVVSEVISFEVIRCCVRKSVVYGESIDNYCSVSLYLE